MVQKVYYRPLTELDYIQVVYFNDDLLSWSDCGQHFSSLNEANDYITQNIRNGSSLLYQIRITPQNPYHLQ